MEWNKKFKDHLQEHEVSPPDECWSSIQTKLQQEKIFPIASPFAKAISWLKYSAAALVTGITLFTFINNPFRNALQNAVMGSGTKAAVVDSTVANQIDSTFRKDSSRQL